MSAHTDVEHDPAALYRLYIRRPGLEWIFYAVLLIFTDVFRDLEEFLPPGRPRSETAGSRVVTHAIRSLKPDRLWRIPVLFLLEAMAALLTILAVRDAMAGADGFLGLAAMAFACWAALLAVAIARTVGVWRRWRARDARRQ